MVTCTAVNDIAVFNRKYIFFFFNFYGKNFEKKKNVLYNLEGPRVHDLGEGPRRFIINTNSYESLQNQDGQDAYNYT